MTSKNKVSSIMLSVATFLMMFSQIYNYTKYIGLIIIMTIGLHNMQLKGVKKTTLYLSVILFLTWIIGMPFQSQLTTMVQVIFAILYYIVLLVISLFGEYIITDLTDLKNIFIGAFVGLIVVFFYSPQKLFTQINNFLTSQSLSRARVRGSFLHPNSLGIYAVLIICLIAVIYEINKYNSDVLSKGKKCITFLTILFCLVLVYLSNSRGALVVLSAFITVYFLGKIQNIQLGAKIFISILLLITLIYTSYLFISEYAVQDISYASRIEGANNLNLKGVRIVYGYGMTNSEGIDYSVLEAGTMEIAWVKLYYKNGLVGIASFVAILIRNLLLANKTLTRDKFVLWLAVLILLLTNSLVESMMITIFNAFSIIIWILISALPHVMNQEATNCDY